MRKCCADLGAGAGFFALAAAFGVQLHELEGVSRVFPSALIVFVGIGGVYFLVKGGIGLLRERAAAASDKPDWPRIGLISALALGYALCLDWLGFFASTMLFLVMAYMILNEAKGVSLGRKAFSAVLFGGLFSIAVWACFVKLLNVPTPAGLLF
ncbi:MULTISPECIES: tripartite tricarboxylate transporter TctB family protein [unclassified Desulfovibrio]|uniref:tripartite tricarboxylate transporter TctB family protein n=1 Tax=unclassified Desulfovibrio TaxID=2593640 RepID=UPI00163ADC2A|nr:MULTISPECIES: tripartite tricarboxylate transporter TctB family protein [unclassified Desulfovibrio]